MFKRVICPNCGSKVDDAKYTCPNCGHKFENNKKNRALTLIPFWRQLFFLSVSFSSKDLPMSFPILLALLL